MVKLSVFLLCFGVMVACASHQYANNDGPHRDIASFAQFGSLRPVLNGDIHKTSAIVVGPNADVIFFVKVKNEILIKECEPLSSIKDANCSSGSGRVVRGGGWHNVARVLRSALRVYDSPGYRFQFLGARLVRTAK